MLWRCAEVPNSEIFTLLMKVGYCRVDGCGTDAAAAGDEVDAYSKAATPRGPAHISTR